MNFQELLRQTAAEDILRCIEEIYPQEKQNLDNFRRVMANLKKQTPNSGANALIRVIQILDADKQHTCEAGVLFAENDDGILAALDNLPWSSIIAFTVHQGDLQKIGAARFAAECLYDMTWDGFDEADVQNFWQSLQTDLNNAENIKHNL